MNTEVPPDPGSAPSAQPHKRFQPRDPAAPPPKHPHLGSHPAGEKPAFPGSLIILGLLFLVGAYVVWKQILSPPAPAPANTQESKAGKDPKKKPKPAARDSLAARKQVPARGKVAAADSAARGAAAAGAAAAAKPTRWSIREEGQGETPQDPESYRFARVAWERPDSKALEAKVNRLDEGFDGRPIGSFHIVEGKQVFLRGSIPVNYAKDRKLDRIPESAISEYLPEWYQRGFTLHFRGNREPFSPRLFRLKEPPGAMPHADEGKDQLVNYAVFAYVDQPEALLIYPDPLRKNGEGANGFMAASELRAPEPAAAFGLDYFRGLTRGRVDSLRTYSLADRGMLLVEVHARRTPVDPPPGEKPSGRRGIFTFLVKPQERKVAFLVHDFDPRFCHADKDIRFLGALDVEGDETPELLLGPRPTILVHEDAEGIKYHRETGYACAE